MKSTKNASSVRYVTRRSRTNSLWRSSAAAGDPATSFSSSLSGASGERWMARHPGTFLYSLDDALALAKRLTTKNFGPELARRASAAAAM